MNAAEREIYHYLKLLRPKCVPARDINRHVGSKRKYHYNPDWAKTTLLQMVERGILEADAEGSYRLKPMPPRDSRGKRWASPKIAEILRASGKAFDNLITPEDEDEYYDNL
jgi:hypothetical protein